MPTLATAAPPERRHVALLMPRGAPEAPDAPHCESSRDRESDAPQQRAHCSASSSLNAAAGSLFVSSGAGGFGSPNVVGSTALDSS